MVTPEELEALDLMCWLCNGDDAALLGYCNQSTISRRSQHALKTFQLKPNRALDLHQLAGNSSLVQMEREVHQLYRLSGRSRLRLHAPYGASRLLSSRLDPDWMLNPARKKEPVGAALRLLEDRVIDALIAEPVQRPADNDPTFFCFDLSKAPLLLCGIQEAGNPLFGESNLTSQDVGRIASFNPFPFASTTTKECGSHLFDSLYGGYSCDDDGGPDGPPSKRQSTFFISPTLLLPEFSHFDVVNCECGFEAKESLVVLRGLEESPKILGLLEMLSHAYLPILRDYPDVTIDKAFV